MRKIFGIISAMAILTLAAGCVKEEIVPNAMEEGIPVTAKLKFGLDGADDVSVTTKAELNSYSEIISLFLFIYNADGTICEQVEEYGQAALTDKGSNGEGHHYYTADIHTTSGEKKIYGVANYNQVQNWKDFEDEIRRYGQKAMDGATADTISASLFHLIDRYVNEGTTIQFSTAQMIFSGTENITVNRDGSTDKPLKVERIVADIEFNIVNGTTDEGNTVAFRPTTYRIYNLPSVTRLSPGRGEEDNPAEANPDYYYNSTDIRINTTTDQGYYFDFFMPENVQPTSKTPVTTFHEREAWDGNAGASPEDKVFTHVTGNATFVVISGEYAEYDSNNNLVRSGSTSYTIHLGDFSNEYRAAHPDNPFGDYSIRRNCSYIYTITIKGADAIIAEAEKRDPAEKPYQQGSEGSIVNIGEITRSFSLDAHYEQVLLSYNLTNILESVQGVQEDVDEAIGNYLMLYIDTPFQNGIVEIYPYTIYSEAEAKGIDPATAKANALSGADYKWVEFFPQKQNTSLSAYPGLPLWKNNNVDINTRSDLNEKIIDAYDLCVKLGKVVRKMKSGYDISTNDYAEDGITVTFRNGRYYAYFTGFVDEYYYYTNPATGAAMTKWSEFVNKDPRTMMISMEVQASEDGNSISSSVHTYIMQRSIQTFYDDTRADDLCAFGIETFNETPRMSNGGYSAGDYDDNGRLNTINVVTGISRNWARHIYQTANGFLQSVGNDDNRKRSNAYYSQNMAYTACMSRNRDLDGDGQIDNDEIRWYLPSANEYLRIGMGAPVLPSEAQLYDINTKNNMTSGYPENFLDDGALYFTSTESKRVYWAMEKGSYGTNLDAGGRYEIRCARLLPANDLDDLSQVPDATFISKRKATTIVSGPSWWPTTKTVYNYVIDCRNVLVPTLYRATIANLPLIPHTEDDPENRFSDGFVISREFLSGGQVYGVDDIQNRDQNQRTDPCSNYHEEGDPEGAGIWRVPNLSELTIMASAPSKYLDNRAWVMASTDFSAPVREAFLLNSSMIITCDLNGHSTFYVRCVRDATEEELNNAVPE
ncbi:MAG: DUF4906 domain-containing protein [Bacteroidetes bacterium]|uniref:DUF4906 domain-containing protein n=1 Tax=Candidatus Cryptobacteroides faecigallinarum TaxID=2840763 RepID=A0A9D9IN25_9BACT|nr:DUF4906 domain-containing protein [Candidatus Cryptobacteroides faecigallinarum]